MIALTINGERREVDVPPDMPILWLLRDVLGMTVYTSLSMIVAEELDADWNRVRVDKVPRLQAALDPVKQKSGWGTPLPARCGRGVSAQTSFASFIATVVECSVNDDGEIALRRVTTAVDTGLPVNPDTIVAQLQSGVIFGLSAARRQAWPCGGCRSMPA